MGEEGVLLPFLIDSPGRINCFDYSSTLLIVIAFQERLDFSCALFGPDGGLVSNAPHIPVHLGAMQEAVQYQVMTTR